MKRQLLHTLLAITALCAASGLTGCSSKSMNTVERAQPAGEAMMVSDKRILTDASLNRRARILSVNEAMTPGGLLQIQVQVMNTTSSLKRVNYRFEWFDQNGMQVSTPANAALNQIQIDGKETKFISSIAPTHACRDFRLKLIEAK